LTGADRFSLPRETGENRVTSFFYSFSAWAGSSSDGQLLSAETRVKRADAPTMLEYTWRDFDIRWELEALGAGTRLTLWTNIARPFISMGAAGWHICFDVLDRLLAGQPIGRIVGPKAMKFDGWQRLNAEYATQFGVETPNWPPQAAQQS